MKFSNGEKVICKVGAETPLAALRLRQPLKNKEYVVCKCETHLGVDIVYLDGFKPGEFFISERFRPLHDEISDRIIKEVSSYPKYLR